MNIPYNLLAVEVVTEWAVAEVLVGKPEDPVEKEEEVPVQNTTVVALRR